MWAGGFGLTLLQRWRFAHHTNHGRRYCRNDIQEGLEWLGQVGVALMGTRKPMLPGGPWHGVAQCLGGPAARRSATWTGRAPHSTYVHALARGWLAPSPLSSSSPSPPAPQLWIQTTGSSSTSGPGTTERVARSSTTHRAWRAFPEDERPHAALGAEVGSPAADSHAEGGRRQFPGLPDSDRGSVRTSVRGVRPAVWPSPQLQLNRGLRSIARVPTLKNDDHDGAVVAPASASHRGSRE